MGSGEWLGLTLQRVYPSRVLAEHVTTVGDKVHDGVVVGVGVDAGRVCWDDEMDQVSQQSILYKDGSDIRGGRSIARAVLLNLTVRDDGDGRAHEDKFTRAGIVLAGWMKHRYIPASTKKE